MDIRWDTRIEMKYPIWETNISDMDLSTDIHPHTMYSDSSQTITGSLGEARENGVYEKGAIEHGNPQDEDIDHVATFPMIGEDNASYSSKNMYLLKYGNLEENLEDDGGVLLNNIDKERLQEDMESIRAVDEKGEITEEDTLNYVLVVPHGVELDYNPAIEFDGNQEEPVDSYEEGLIDFLKEAESSNAGYNYILASSHYVNTPFRPRYVKRDQLFSGMEDEEKRQVLEHYRDKEILKINSLSEKLSHHEIPRVSEELMDQEEIGELEDFIYSHEVSIGERDSNQSFDISEVYDGSIDIERPGVFVVGAHPTLIERNEELMDVFRKDDGISTTSEIRDDLESFIYDTDIEGVDVDLSDSKKDWINPNRVLDEMMTEEDFVNIYPDEALRSYYEPMIRASEDSDNFIFEINGKGVERQIPSVFWYMLDENTFGSDAHRPEEQPERSKIYSEKEISADLKFLSEKWLQQMQEPQEVSEDVVKDKRQIKV